MSLRDLIAHVPQRGRVTWIAVRPSRDEPMRPVDHVEAVLGRGLVGDRYRGRGPRGKRQVSLIQAEHLPVVASLLGRPVDPLTLRRNLVVEGINLHALQRLRFQIGEVVLDGTGPCAPCSKMDARLGDGGYAALQGMGGIVARVVRAGTLRVGDPVVALGWPDEVAVVSADGVESGPVAGGSGKEFS
ncbi:MAG: MOSC domain-containing protein [Sandaracinus sp.]|nr:MOSC domain-containing protein [Sandaracinus sp.]|tara:strand:+ start:47 stop:607 length:561 start_codon:yes stop_codon:yes gene_type:complete